MSKDQALSLARTALKVGGAILVQRGYTDSAGLEAIIGCALAVFGAVWSHSEHKTEPVAPVAPKP